MRPKLFVHLYIIVKVFHPAKQHKIAPFQFVSFACYSMCLTTGNLAQLQLLFFLLHFIFLNETLEILFVKLASCAVLGNDNKNS